MVKVDQTVVKTEAGLGFYHPLHARNPTTSAQDNKNGFVLFLNYVSIWDKKASIQRFPKPFNLATVSWQCSTKVCCKKEISGGLGGNLQQQQISRTCWSVCKASCLGFVSGIRGRYVHPLSWCMGISALPKREELGLSLIWGDTQIHRDRRPLCSLEGNVGNS